MFSESICQLASSPCLDGEVTSRRTASYSQKWGNRGMRAVISRPIWAITRDPVLFACLILKADYKKHKLRVFFEECHPKVEPLWACSVCASGVIRTAWRTEAGLLGWVVGADTRSGLGYHGNKIIEGRASSWLWPAIPSLPTLISQLHRLIFRLLSPGDFIVHHHHHHYYRIICIFFATYRIVLE